MRNAKNINTLLNHVTSRISMGNNARTVTIRVTNKRSSVKNKKMTEKKKIKRLMSLKRYITTKYILEKTHLRAKIIEPTRKLSKCSLLTHNIRHIW